MHKWYNKKKIKNNLRKNNTFNALSVIEKDVARDKGWEDTKPTIGSDIINAYKSLEIGHYFYNDNDVSSHTSKDDSDNEEVSNNKSQWMTIVENYIHSVISERMEYINRYFRNTLNESTMSDKDILEYFIFSCPGEKGNVFDEYDSHSVSATTVNTQEFLGNTNRFSPINSDSKYVTYDTYCNYVLGLLSIEYIRKNIVEINVNQLASKHKLVDLQKRIYFIQYYLMGLFDRTEYLKKCYEYERESLEEDTKGEVFNLSQTQKEARIKKIDENLLNIEFSKGELTYQEYLKNYHTIHGQKWVNFSLNPDPDDDNPDMVEIDVEYNDYFIDWLKSKDLEYDPNKFESYQNLDRDSEEYKELMIEGWAKNTLMRTAASLLAENQEGDEYGDTFQSVLASSPEGSLVDNIEIDKDSYNNDDEFNDVLQYVKNRRMYK